MAVVAESAHVHYARRRAQFDAVADRVLRERLQQQRRNRSPPRLGRYIDRERHPIGKTGALDFEIPAQHGQLRVERDLLIAGVIERVAQQLAETGQHGDRFIVAFHANESADGVERVEEEVRLDLQLQRVQARVGERRLELRRLQRALAIALVKVEGDGPAEDHAVEEELEREAVEKDVGDIELRRLGGHAVERLEREHQSEPVEAVDDGDCTGGEYVYEDGKAPRRNDRKAARQPDDHDGGEKPSLRDQDVVENQQRHGVAVRDHADPDLDAGDHSE